MNAHLIYDITKSTDYF